MDELVLEKIDSGCEIVKSHRACRGVGYPIKWVSNTKTMAVSRYIYEKHNGKIPDGMYVCHACDNIKCVNIDHLFLGTQKDNMHDSSVKGRIAYAERNKAAKLTSKDVAAIRKSGETITEKAKKYGVDYTTILRVVSMKSWKRLLPEAKEKP